MMDEMLATMASDMEIDRFHGESDDSYTYRICYSALGLWCLHTAQNVSKGSVGTTKRNQTSVLNDIQNRFLTLYPNISNRFNIHNSPNFSVHIRKVYEETGYLLTNKYNNNRLANFGRSIQIGSDYLFFGLPSWKYSLNGLGIFTNQPAFSTSISEFLIRDCLTSNEYFQSRFNIIDFHDRDIALEDLEFFNPKSKNVPSNSWEKELKVEYTIARKTKMGPYFRIIRDGNTTQFFEEAIESQDESFISYEYRRLYFALKHYYNNPVNVTITKCDENYSKLRVGGQLPNREYYFMLLVSWPENNVFDKVRFIVKNNFLNDVIKVLNHLGIGILGEWK